MGSTGCIWCSGVYQLPQCHYVMINRATEQEKLDFPSFNFNSTNDTNGNNSINATQELNLHFYLGIYAGMLVLESQ